MPDLEALIASSYFWGLISILVGGLIFAAGLRSRSPNLVATGPGSGGRPGAPSHHTISIRNDPSFFGIRIGRDTAKVTASWIEELPKKDVHWVMQNWVVGAAHQSSVEIPVGESASLLVFYSTPDNLQFALATQLLEEGTLAGMKTYADHREFRLVLRDSLDRKTIIPIEADIRHGRFYFGYAYTMQQRIRHLRKGFRFIGMAFSFQRFYR